MIMDNTEDWTLAGMLKRRLAANGGKPLSPEQIAEVKAAHDEIAAAEKALDDYLAKKEETEREQQRISDLEELAALKAQLKEVEELEKLMEIRTWVEQAEKYSWGEGVPQDYDEAVKWYRKAAVHGDATAQYNLGVFYDQGKGVSQDYAEAVEWYRKAAAQGHASAQNNLGACYYAGQGVPQDYIEAVKWYRNAAEQGHADGQFSLGYCYELGNGVPQDHAEAHKWYRKAASQGHTESQFCLDREHYQNIVSAFCDLTATHVPLIGDCNMLPHPQKTILYAIKWVTDYLETEREATTDQTLCEKLDDLISTHNYLLTELARDWHEIDPKDKAVVAELGKFDSFPDWALPLKLKYIDDEKARKEALDATFEVLKDRVATKDRITTMSVNPSDPAFGRENKLVTKSEYEQIKQIIRRRANDTSLPSREGPGFEKDVTKKSLIERLSRWIKRWW
jgi:TPR repeat protein